MMYQKIFCPVDGSETSDRGMAEAIRIAKQQNAQLCFLHVVDNGALIMYAPVVESVFDAMRKRGQEILDNAVAAARAQGISAQHTLLEIMTGRVAPIIVEEAEHFHADL